MHPYAFAHKLLSKPDHPARRADMRTYAISFNGNAPESWVHASLVDAFDSYEISKLSALDAGQKLHFNDGTVAACVVA